MSRPISRRKFLGAAGAACAGLLGARVFSSASGAQGPPSPQASLHRPNIILAMTDDQGWGDTGYNGHPVLKTPTLDEMAATGLRFDRFYAAAPVCSPTRGSCLTGRHPYRYGVFFANRGHMPPQEVTLAEALKLAGYTTGHFGKWHLGTLTKTVRDSNRGGRPQNAKHFSPPWENGFDVCFSTEAKVPTYNPMLAPGTNKPYGTYYWNERGERVTENLEGDDSRVIMDRVIPFVRNAVAQGKPFFAVIWFHAPHRPVLAGPKYRAMYADQPEGMQHYYGCITAMDEQLGRLRAELRKLGVAENTMLWFCSDNGPEGRATSEDAPGTAGPFRGRKRSLYEGGVRVPGILEWPAKIKKGRVTAVPCCTSDYYPTIIDVLGLKVSNQPLPLDGISLLPLIEGKMPQRPRPIAFQSGNQLALSDNRYKIISTDGGKSYQLFDLLADREERNDLAQDKPDIVARMKEELGRWRESCRQSLAGKDYRQT